MATQEIDIRSEALNHDTPAWQLAKEIVEGLDGETRRFYAIFYVADQIDRYRRLAVRDIESRIEVNDPSVYQRLIEQEQAHQQEQTRAQERVRAQELKQFEACRDDPINQALPNRPLREDFRHWMSEAFKAWYADWHTRLEERGCEKSLESFEADWDPRGIMAYYADRRLEKIMDLTQRYADELRLELTEELLGAEIALGDGERTTWGMATKDQHQRRLVMLAKHAHGTIETGARHEAALRMLEESGATCLSEIAAQESQA